MDIFDFGAIFGASEGNGLTFTAKLPWLTLPPTAYLIHVVPQGEATEAPTLKVIDRCIFESCHEYRKLSLYKDRNVRNISDHSVRAF